MIKYKLVDGEYEVMMDNLVNLLVNKPLNQLMLLIDPR